MALAFDTSGGDYEYNTSTSGCTFNLTAGAANSIAILFVRFTYTGATSAWANTPTVGGNSATQIGSDHTISGEQMFRAYYYLNPPTSSTAYLVTTDDINVNRDIGMQVLIYSDANQSGQPDSNASANATGNLTLSTTVVAANCWLVSCARNIAVGPPTAGSGTTIRGAGTEIAFAAGDSNGTVGTGSQSMGWNAAASTTGGIIVSIAPTAPVAALTPRVSFIM